MLLERIEGNSKHIFYNSNIGVSDWISRSGDKKYQVQIISAYLNYSYLSMFESDTKIEIEPLKDNNLFSELKDMSNSYNQKHSLNGGFLIRTDREAILTFNRHYLESVRGIRMVHEGYKTEHDEFIQKHNLIAPKVEVTEQNVFIQRTFGERLEYQVRLKCDSGSWEIDETGKLILKLLAGSNVLNISQSVEGRWSDEDLSSFKEDEIALLNNSRKERFYNLNEKQQGEIRNQLQALSLLARKTKLLAGGPRFFNYFGRDSLISIALLSGTVISELTLQGLRSVLQRLSEKGETAHEESIGEFAALIKEDNPSRKIPKDLLEYHMVDDDFLLPAVIKQWLENEDKSILMVMLNSPVQNETDGYYLLARNLHYCIDRIREGLIPYLSGIAVGDWRDSLAFQEIDYSYELNVGLASYFLQTYRYLLKELPLLTSPVYNLPDPDELDVVQDEFISQTETFKVEVNIEEKKEHITNWLKTLDFDSEELSVLEERLKGLLNSSKVYEYYAMALREDRSVINIQHNDTAFNLLFGNPNAGDLSRMLIPFETYFPLGLKTDAGILVSNPVFCDDEIIRTDMGRSHYHGLVIWPLLHNILHHGLRRQIKIYKKENQQDLLKRMESLLDYLNGLDLVLQDLSTSELWTFSPGRDGDKPVVYGFNTDVTMESNPVQLWSSLGFTSVLAI